MPELLQNKMKNFTKLVDKQFLSYVSRLPAEKKNLVAELQKNFEQIVDIVENNARKDGRYKKYAFKMLDDAIILAMKAISIAI